MSISSSLAVSMMIGTWLRLRMPAADLDAVELRQHDVQDDEVESLLGETVQRLAAVVRGNDLVALLSQRVGEKRLHGLLVVDEQDACRRSVRSSHVQPRRVISKPLANRTSQFRAKAPHPPDLNGTSQFRLTLTQPHDRLPHLPCRLRTGRGGGRRAAVRAHGAARSAADSGDAGGIRRSGGDPAGAPGRRHGARPDPGSEGDARVGDFVAQRFGQVDGGEVSEQNFTGQLDGNDVDMRNVILTLPGNSARTVVVMAPRDSAGGPGAASSAAATGMLLQLVNQLRTQSHNKTLVFVSTDGSSAGAAGAERVRPELLAAGRDRRGDRPVAARLRKPAAVLRPRVVRRPTEPAGAARPHRRARAVGSDAPQAGGRGNARRPGGPGGAERAGRDGRADPERPRVGGPLVGRGAATARVPGPGREPVAADGDRLRATALLLAAAIDASPEPLDHGPSTYVPMAGNLVPGWTLALLALTLLVPAALAAGDGILKGYRAGSHPGWALAWAGSRAVPLLAGLFLLLLLALVGLVARPTFPFDPNLYGVGPGQVIVMLLCAGIIGGTYYAIRGWLVPAALSRQAAVPALGVVSTVAAFLVWLANPFMGLLLVPTAHVWLTCARRRGALPWPAVAGAALVSLLPLIAAIDHVSGELALGGSAPGSCC